MKGKTRLLYLARILFEGTDDDHKLTTSQLRNKLLELDTEEKKIDRKTLYNDMDELAEVLEQFGYDADYPLYCTLEKECGDKDCGEKENVYWISTRLFEESELRVLVDSVNYAKFITRKDTDRIIGKIKKLTSEALAKKLDSRISIGDRRKTDNKGIHYNIDAIHNAQADDCQITFRYMAWSIDDDKRTPTMKEKHEGKIYRVSPWELVLDNEYYYLIAYEADADAGASGEAEDQPKGQIKHFRIDKMTHIDRLYDVKREGKEKYDREYPPSFHRSLFGMYGAEIEKVEFLFHKDKIGILVDRFGKDIPILAVDSKQGLYRTFVDVAVSDQFLAWAAAVSDGIRIVGGEKVVAKMKGMIRRLMEGYGVEG